MSAESQILLDLIRRSLGLSIGEVQIMRPDGRLYWRISATAASGESWTAEAEDYAKAVAELAVSLGYDLEG